MAIPRIALGIFYVGIDLSFQSVARQVFSAPVSLTSVFGMGTGGPSPLKTPTVNGYCQILNQYDCVVKQNLRPENRTKGKKREQAFLHNVGQALGQLVPISSTRYRAYTSGLSTL